jgi:quercetin dioxygenase-like cupin family protein
LTRTTLQKLLAVLLILVLSFPGVGQGQSVQAGVSTSFESHFTAPQPLPAAPLDQIFQIVDLAPGAATVVHFHEGPGFATILQGEVTHQRLIVGQDNTYGLGATWVELPEDVHYARNEGAVPASILATFILPRSAAGSIATGQQLEPARPEPTVPLLARVPIDTAANGMAVTQLLRTYDPGGSTTSTLAAGSQSVVLVMSGALTVRDGKDSRTVGPGDFWVETGNSSTTAWNDSSSAATVIESTLLPQR